MVKSLVKISPIISFFKINDDYKKVSNLKIEAVRSEEYSAQKMKFSIKDFFSKCDFWKFYHDILYLYEHFSKNIL